MCIYFLYDNERNSKSCWIREINDNKDLGYINVKKTSTHLKVGALIYAFSFVFAFRIKNIINGCINGMNILSISKTIAKFGTCFWYNL